MIRLTSAKLTAAVVLLLVMIGGLLGGVKLQRDFERQDAFEQLQLLGFGSTISAREGVGTAVQFVAPARWLSDAELDRAIASLKILANHEYIEAVDFTKSSVGTEKLISVQALLPECDVRR
jgi:hypothetical protein